jgi:hypothetical protein
LYMMLRRKERLAAEHRACYGDVASGYLTLNDTCNTKPFLTSDMIRR